MQSVDRWTENMPRYRSSWESRHGASGESWDRHEPIYRAAWEKHEDAKFRGRSYTEVEPELRRDWQARHGDRPWDQVSRSFREAWENFSDDHNPRRAANTGGDVRVQQVEERLTATTKPVELGEVTLHKEVTKEQQTVPVELHRDDVQVEERDIPNRPLKPEEADAAFREETIRVPVRGEQAVARKEAIVTGEVVVTKDQVVEHEQITDTVRRTRVDVDENYRQARPAFEQHFARAGHTDRKFEDVEPDYRTGFEAGHDERYANRPFEEVESDLRGSYETGARARQRGGADSWTSLREQIREGFDRARNSR